MKKTKCNKGLLDKTRFERFQLEETLAVRRLPVKKGIKILESLLDSGIIQELKRVQRELNLQECKKK